jgi:hypothetical protein
MEYRMSVYETIRDWLNEILLELQNEFPHPYTILDVNNIPLPTDYSGTDFQAAGLFSSPNDISSELMGGQTKRTDFKSFFIRRPFKEFSSRLENESFFEKLSKKIHERNLDNNFPADGRWWSSIKINAGIYPAQRDAANQFADYLIPLRLVYIE